MTKDTELLAKQQADKHAEFLGEYTKYIYRHAHIHGFKHGYEYALLEGPTYLQAVKKVSKSFQEEV